MGKKKLRSVKPHKYVRGGLTCIILTVMHQNGRSTATTQALIASEDNLRGSLAYIKTLQPPPASPINTSHCIKFPFNLLCGIFDDRSRSGRARGRGERKNPHYFIFNQSFRAERRLSGGPWQRAGFILIMEIGIKIRRTIGGSLRMAVPEHVVISLLLTSRMIMRACFLSPLSPCPACLERSLRWNLKPYMCVYVYIYIQYICIFVYKWCGFDLMLNVFVFYMYLRPFVLHKRGCTLLILDVDVKVGINIGSICSVCLYNHILWLLLVKPVSVKSAIQIHLTCTIVTLFTR